MASAKALEFLDKQDLECAICLERFKDPKTLGCLHTYCLKCLESLMKTNSRIECPKCRTIYELNKCDLKKLISNETVDYLLKLVNKIELEKPGTCKSCKNQPQLYCSECEMYICEECVKHHRIIPALIDHQLYTLDKNEEEENNELNCTTHVDKKLEFFCKDCLRSACEKCRFILDCLKNKHKIEPMKIVLGEFNERVNEIMKTAEEIKNKLKEKTLSTDKDRDDFRRNLRLCRTAVEIHVKTVIKKVEDAGKAIIAELQEIFKEKDKIFENHLQNISLKLIKLNETLLLIKTMENKRPEETKQFSSNEKSVNAMKDEVMRAEFDRAVGLKGITSDFIPSKKLNDVINREGIGKIKNPKGNLYSVREEDRSITVTKGKSFIVNVTSPKEDTYQVSATLRHTSGEMSTPDVKNEGGRMYRITGRCNMEGDWQMDITAGHASIQGSPVNVKVEVGLLHTIDLKKHGKEDNVADILLDTDGCILVSSFSKDLLKFDQTGAFVAVIQVPQNVRINRIRHMDDGNMVYSDDKCKYVVRCDDKLQEIRSFGKGDLQYPDGIIVNTKTRILYVADRECHCVFKFNFDDGRMVGKIGSEGSNPGQMKEPQDVAVTKEGDVIVADFVNNRIQMFGAIHDNLISIIIGSGWEDGKVIRPIGIIVDMDENIIVSSNHKLQLFDNKGKFIKRIDRVDDGLGIPCGITVISKRPRQIAVANNRANNVKIFNY